MTFNQGVRGSNPRWITKTPRYPKDVSGFYFLKKRSGIRTLRGQKRVKKVAGGKFCRFWCEGGAESRRVWAAEQGRRESTPSPMDHQRKKHQGMSSIKEVENLLRDPNGIAVRPSGFDCVRPCHPERSGAKSNCEAAPSKARWDLGRTPLKMTRRGNTCQKSKGARAFVRTPFHTPCPARYSVLHLLDVLSGGSKAFLREEGGPR